ncbi:hypothetical protein IJG14_06600 [bacterium]|nr:hypothetical protein [bacterium]
MARIIRPVWAIRCNQSGCKTIFEVAKLNPGKQQEVICPNCGEHYIYPPIGNDDQSQKQD